MSGLGFVRSASNLVAAEIPGAVIIGDGRLLNKGDDPPDSWYLLFSLA